MRDLAADREVLKNKGGWSSLVALTYLDELERLYAMLELSEGLRVSDRAAISRGINSGKWIVYINGVAHPCNLTPERHDTFRASLHRAWELEQPHG